MTSDTNNQIPAAQVAPRLGVSRDTVIRMIQRGQLEGGQYLTRWWASKNSVRREERRLEAELV